MGSNVVSLRTANSAVASKEDEFVEDLRGMVWSSQGTTGTWQDLADKTGLCYSTVQKFASGDTKRPQGRTLLKLVIAFGYRVAILPASTKPVPGEIDLSQYRNKAKRTA
ncbi:MAG: helix-turn-helix transcriptional regulator [Candidatus Paceibacterota bacterium]